MFFLADTFLKVDKICRARRFVFMHYFHSVLSGHSAILSSDSLELHFVLVHCCPSSLVSKNIPSINLFSNAGLYLRIDDILLKTSSKFSRGIGAHRKQRNILNE